MAAVAKRILGIDPGSHHLGVGCVEQTGNRLRLVFCEIIHAKPKDSLFVRLRTLSSRFHTLLSELQPHEVAIEDVFFAKNVRSALYLGTARGMVLGACIQQGLPIHEYAATQIKSVVTGHGRSDKVQVQKMVQLILGTKIDLGFDATDAVAVALCHASHREAFT